MVSAVKMDFARKRRLAWGLMASLVALSLVSGCAKRDDEATSSGAKRDDEATSSGAKRDVEAPSSGAKREETPTDAKKLVESRKNALGLPAHPFVAAQKLDAILKSRKSLKLTDSQIRNIERTQRDHDAKMKALDDELSKRQKAAEKLAIAANRDQGVTLKQVRQSLAHAAETTKEKSAEREKTWKEMLGALTPEQRAAAEKLPH